MPLMGARSCPFVLHYSLRMLAQPAALALGGGRVMVQSLVDRLAVGAWYAGAVLLTFVSIGRMFVIRKTARTAKPSVYRTRPLS